MRCTVVSCYTFQYEFEATPRMIPVMTSPSFSGSQKTLVDPLTSLLFITELWFTAMGLRCMEKRWAVEELLWWESGRLQRPPDCCLPHFCRSNVLCILWIFAVCVFWIVLISHLPSAGLCEESGSSPRLLCPRWSCSSTPAIRQSCRDSLYASSGEQLQDTVLLHTSGWVVGICLTANELSFGQSLPPTVIAQNTSVSCMMRWTANSVPSEIKRAFLQCRVDGLDEAYGK